MPSFAQSWNFFFSSFVLVVRFVPTASSLTVQYDMQPSSRPTSTSTRPPHSPLPRQHQVNTQTKVLDTSQGRILCIADIRGRLSALNDLARDLNAKAIIHTGDFGFFGKFLHLLLLLLFNSISFRIKQSRQNQ